MNRHTQLGSEFWSLIEKRKTVNEVPYADLLFRICTSVSYYAAVDQNKSDMVRVLYTHYWTHKSNEVKNQ